MLSSYPLSLRILVLFVVSLPTLLSAADFYVTPSSVACGKGTFEAAWDLQTALNQPPEVKPGDTIWLRGGVHRLSNRVTRFVSNLKGAPNAPITVRQYPGERATVDGNIMQAYGGWVVYRDFEIYNSNTNRYTTEKGPFPKTWWVTYNGKQVDLCVSGLDLQAPNVKAINLVIHDSIGGGIGLNTSAKDAEIYGCLIYYNGWQAPDRAHGHGIYSQNAAPSTKNLRDNVIFANLAIGLQHTGNGPDPVADNLHLEGTAFAMNGALAYAHQGNVLVGAFQGVGRSPVLISNIVYDTTLNTLSDCNVGYLGGLSDLFMTGNYISTPVQFGAVSGMTVTNNFFGATCNLTSSNLPENVFSKPATNAVFVRPNRYEPGRANITVCNWQRLTNVTVDVSNIGLNPGDTFELHNTADFYNDVIVGIYDGTPLSVPMLGHSVARPVGANFSLPQGSFPEFGAFVIRRKDGPPAINTRPTLSPIQKQRTKLNTPTDPISFTVTDAETPTEQLTLIASSTNQRLVPSTNIAIAGTGDERSITVYPASNEVGVTTITLTASDGQTTSQSRFDLRVDGPPSLSVIPDQIAASGTQVGPLQFTVTDVESWARDLLVTATSSNQDIIPDANIALAGADQERTVTITPVTNQIGTATITIKASDGSNVSSMQFAVTVH